MLGNTYFYNKSLKTIVAVFGTLFNNISIAKLINGKMQGISRVPLSYAPRQKFLARLSTYDVNNPIDVAVRLPRMSFEITSIQYDTSSKLNRLNSTLYPISETNTIEKARVYQSTPYILGMQLNILARHQDDALQCVEQILPYFNPEYNITVKDLEGPGSRTDIPITLQGVSFQDDYEGDFESSRRTIIYTLDFTIRVKFTGPIDQRAKIIKWVEAKMHADMNISATSKPDEIIRVEATSEPDAEGNFTVSTTYGFIEDLPPISDTLSGLEWRVERNVGGDISVDSLNGPTLEFVSDMGTDTSEYTVSTRFFNNSENQDPNGVYAPSGEVTLYLNWLSNPQHGTSTPGYLSSDYGDYIKVYANGELILSSENGVSTKSPQSQSVTIPANQEVILTYRVLKTKGSSLNATVQISYYE
jgi:hypothetical protein